MGKDFLSGMHPEQEKKPIKNSGNGNTNGELPDISKFLSGMHPEQGGNSIEKTKNRVSDIIDYDPANKKYQKVSDLPLGMQDEFVDVDGGFVRKGAKGFNDYAHKKAYENHLYGNEEPTTQDGVLKNIGNIYNKDRTLFLEYLALPKEEREAYYNKNKKEDGFFLPNILENGELDSGFKDNNKHFKHFFEKNKYDRDFLIKVITYIPKAFKYYPYEHRNDLEIATLAIKGESLNYDYISQRLKREIEFPSENIYKKYEMLQRMTDGIVDFRGE